MREQLAAEAARQFSQAADTLVDACRRLEQLGVADPPVERLLQALDEVVRQVKQIQRPEGRGQLQSAHLAAAGHPIAADDAGGAESAVTRPEQIDWE